MRLIITGGTGSLGRAILRQQELLKQNGITRIRILSRGEEKQVQVERAYRGEIPLDCYLADVTDRERMRFAIKDADFIIHAAAQKHIDKFELDIPTGHRTNILGTQYVGEAFLDAKNAKSGIFVSTDKACLPITSYGVSKLAAENLWLWHNTFQNTVKFGIARYGNIINSSGSVIQTWTDMARRKQQLKITDPECTRFFMLVSDGAKFVLNNLFANTAKLNVPPMKSIEMVRAAKLIWESYNSEKFQYDIIGMRSVEKKHEVLTDQGLSSDSAERLTDGEFKEMYKQSLDLSQM